MTPSENGERGPQYKGLLFIKKVIVLRTEGKININQYMPL